MLQSLEDHLCSYMCSNQVEAEVIVHSQLSDPGKEEDETSNERGKDFISSRGPSLMAGQLSSSLSQTRETEPLENLSLVQSPSSLPTVKLVDHHNGVLEATGGVPSADSEPQHDMGLTNGYHSPKIVRCVLQSEHLENGDSRHCPSAPGKVFSVGRSPAPFVSSGLVHSTSAAHSYLCP